MRPRHGLVSVSEVFAPVFLPPRTIHPSHAHPGRRLPWFARPANGKVRSPNYQSPTHYLRSWSILPLDFRRRLIRQCPSLIRFPLTVFAVAQEVRAAVDDVKEFHAGIFAARELAVVLALRLAQRRELNSQRHADRLAQCDHEMTVHFAFPLIGLLRRHRAVALKRLRRCIKRGVPG